MSPGDAGASSKARGRSSWIARARRGRRRSSDSISSASHWSGWPKIIGDFLPVEHVVADRLAAHGVAVGLRHASAPASRLGGDLQLVERALPLAEHAEQLKEEDAQLRIGRPGAHLLLQLRQRRDGIPALQALFGDIGEAHGVTS